MANKKNILPRRVTIEYDDTGVFLRSIFQYQIEKDNGSVDPKVYSIGINNVVDKKEMLEIVNSASRHSCVSENMEVKDVQSKSIK